MNDWHHTPTFDTPLTINEWRRILNEEDQLAAILRELIRVGNTPTGRGPRPAPNPYTTQQILHRLVNPPEPLEQTTKRFPDALRDFTKQYSLRGLEHRTGIPKSTIHQWLTDETTPNVETQTRIAAALKLPETYFLETRHAVVGAWLTYQLDQNPTVAQHIIDHITHHQN